MNDSNTETLSTSNDDPYAAPPTPGGNASSPTAGYLAVALAVVAGLIRVIPHPWNFTPVAALGLFGGARLRPWQALTLPFVVMVVSDLFIWGLLGWPPFNPLVYGCFAVTVLLGLALRRTKSWLLIGGASVAASLLFFLVTNFGVWYTSRVDPQELPAGAGMVRQTEGARYSVGMIRYSDNSKGLLTCYLMGLNFSAKDAPPLGFTGNLLAGNLFFTALLFGAQAWLSRRVAKPQAAKSGIGQPASVRS
jgi:hypothetical protein